ncbi:MAG TPA: type II/IV secretion system ATPase subunit [Candidatus Pacearchaeota archaeon]|jgi:type IV secretory pathway ATPase VirB11/archaellum biosynthesis ATPase|nr:type II/IV secretion system ATPase subunit [Candidatus Pacearchaeota archaeon]HOC96653.1 type II/IV secretion system ATPase subunit [Candidatus Pacearchaeota archaeon]HOF43919.1 type II/IV secretion system ATPase subunit [Candidatus Pacearchaeota archaeon]HOH04072.1 type II/IV secretion system ATPase subunit [Candidatus Pacearchaeota archaeon]HOR52122.1 type II/IV secretion system ATPase subunit [Candidatus Pacearchaeota archaeon]
MQFGKEDELYSYEVKREGGEDVLYINYMGAPYVPSLAEHPEVMERTIDSLIENPQVSRVVFVQQKNYNYDFKETGYLLEIAQFYVYLVKQEKILSQEKLITSNPDFFPRRYNEMFSFLYLLKKDPLSAYFQLRKIILEGKIILDKLDGVLKLDQKNYLALVEKILENFSKTNFIQTFQQYSTQYKRGDREIYHKLFRPDVIANFTFTRLVSDLPRDAEIISQYKISNGEDDESNVTILRKKNESKLIYHLVPPENTLTEDQSIILNLARGVLIEHQPKAEEFTDTERVRQVFMNISKDLIRDLSQSRDIKLDYSSLNKLSSILVRHTIGFGIVEVLLQDKNLQDISLNAPIPQTPIFVRHQEYDQCTTNILPSQEDADSWAAKFRMISGRPLDEANPILDTQLEIGTLRARISIVQQPLSCDGLAYSIRRHRESPWTLPLFIQNKMINPFGAGLLSFLIDGARTLLVAGTRSSGKTSLLGSLMLEIVPKHRIIVIEDSLELPVEALRKLNYDILRMKVRSALLKTTTEVSAEDGIRTSLRLGDSCLIIGEVRSVEAKALYEAMRVGALANVVAGTIHGASPYGVFDRVVNDLEVPITSFKATDSVIVCNPIKSPDGLHAWKRLIQLSEVRKHWTKDPLAEKGFVDLMKYNIEKDELEPTEDLINGDSQIIKDVASNVKGWAGNWDAVYDNILLRSKIKNELVNVAKKTSDYDLLESKFNTLSNHAFHRISDEIIQEVGLPLGERVFPVWQEWLNKEIKKRII